MSDAGTNGESSLLAASWLNLILWTAEIALAVLFLQYGRPSKYYKLLVAAALITDTVCTIAICANVHLYLVTFPLRGSFPTTQQWTTPVTIFATYTSSCIEQSVFTLRYWTLTHNRIVTIIISFFIFTHMLFATIATFWVVAHPALSERFGFTASIVAATLCCTTDIMIAVFLCWDLYRIRAVYDSTKALIRWVAMRAVTCGVITATMTATMIILLFTDFAAFTFFFDILGRVYTLSVLFNLLMLRKPSTVSGRSGSSVGATGAIDAIDVFSSIHFQHSTRRESFANGDRRPAPRKLSLPSPVLESGRDRRQGKGGVLHQASTISMNDASLQKDLPLVP